MSLFVPENFKPILAGKYNGKVKYPVMASPKLDGIRTLGWRTGPVSRTLKPIPNKHIHQLMPWDLLKGLDSELIAGDPTSSIAFNNTTRAVMSRDTVDDDITLWVFDDFLEPNRPFEKRLEVAQNRIKCLPQPHQHHVKLVEHKLIENQAQLEDFEEDNINKGYEGIMLRSLDGRYKYGRSTTNEGILLKYKRFVDAEAVIIGFEELMHNGNEATKDNLGHTERSSHKENLTGMNTLGALIVRHASGVEFNIGTGFDAATRQEIWDNQDKYFGEVAKYKFFPHGMLDRPRHPVFLGIRKD